MRYNFGLRILQVTNFVNHLQLPVARQLASIVGENNFRFAAVSKLDTDRLNLGWRDKYTEPWILRVSENKFDLAEFNNWWDTADVVISGERYFKRMSNRIKNGRLCFYMSERWWKPPIGIMRIFSPRFFSMLLQFKKLVKNSAFHYLSKGPFASRDIDLIANLSGRKWKWGYFSENFLLKKFPNQKESKIIKILWAGRMLKWKRVDTLILSIADLSKRGFEINLTIAGEGPEINKLKKLAKKILNPAEYLFCNSINPDKIPQLMFDHDIFVLPSSAYEGWGFVINEAMNSECAVIASQSAGAAAAMIKHNVNGLLFKSGNWRELSSNIELLINDKELRYTLINNARITVQDKWSPNCAAKRFISVVNALLNNKNIPIYEDGPMSKT